MKRNDIGSSLDETERSLRPGWGCSLRVLRWVTLAAILWTGAFGASFGQAAGEWRSLFNGNNLAGWVNVNCAPNTWTVRDGMIISTGVPTGVMRSEHQYENFELELEYRHMKAGGNAGLFVWSDPITSPGVPFARSIEVQILDGRNTDNYTSHGDVFAIHGATFKPMHPHPGGWMRCLPSERRARPAGEWNHYRVTCSNGVLRLAVNGKEVSGGSESKPRKGYICLESEGSECHFRNLRLREWPTTHPKPDEIAPLAEGFQPLYTGVDLSGWKVESGNFGPWRTNDWILECDGASDRTNQLLWTEQVFGDFVLMVDWRLTKEPGLAKFPQVSVPSGEFERNADGTMKLVESLETLKSAIVLRGLRTALLEISSDPRGSGGVSVIRSQQTDAVGKAIRPSTKADKPLGEWNRFEITLRGDQLTVVLNGKTVVNQARLAGAPREGAIALRHRGTSVQFANLFIKKLD